jgi:cardiolipin synthase
MPGLLRLVEIWWTWIDLGATALAVASIPSVLVQRRGRPTAAVSWILCLLALPTLGLVLWWFIGRAHLARRRRKRLTKHDTIQQHFANLRAEIDVPPSHASMVTFRHLPPELADSVFPATTGNTVELLPTGATAFACMEEVIRDAKHHVHVLFYIWKNDATGRRFRDMLIDRANSGVEVRVLCDAVGSPVMATAFSRPLRRAGAKVARFLPPQLFHLPRINFRNHRKILVADGRIGIIGGFNIGDEYRTRWRDMGVRISGPAVDQLQEIFADDWYYASDENLASPVYFGRWSPTRGNHGAAVAAIASGPDTQISPIHDGLFMAINQSEERLFITTPYFIPTPPILTALRAAVYRGVDVRIMLPALSDVPLVRHAARSYYPELLSVGARIFEYQPEMLHAKASVFDRDLSVLGSANLDNRSFKLNFEASAFIAGRELNQALAAQFEADLSRCEEITSESFERLPWPSKLLDATAHLLSPLL